MKFDNHRITMLEYKCKLTVRFILFLKVIGCQGEHVTLCILVKDFILLKNNRKLNKIE